MLASDFSASLPTLVTQTPLKELLGRYFSKYVLVGELQQAKKIVMLSTKNLLIENIVYYNLNFNLKKEFYKILKALTTKENHSIKTQPFNGKQGRQ